MRGLGLGQGLSRHRGGGGAGIPTTLLFDGDGDWIDEEATNLIPYSRSFDNSWWNKPSLTLAAATAPDGTNTAFKATPGAGSASNRFLRRLTSDGFTISGVRGLSIHWKSDDIPYLYMLPNNATTSDYVVFDVATGEVSHIQGSNITDAGSEESEEGFRRYWLIYNGAGADNEGFTISPSQRATGTNNVAYSGTQSFTAWQADYVVLPELVSPIPTSGSAVTKPPVEQVLEEIGATLNPTEGTFIVVHDAEESKPLLSFDGGAAFMTAAAHSTILTYDAEGTTLYGDGGFFSSGDPIVIGDDLHIGFDDAGWMNARLFSVRYVDRALTEEEAFKYYSHPSFGGDILSLLAGG